jgi:hypothetical protein
MYIRKFLASASDGVTYHRDAVSRNMDSKQDGSQQL